MKSKFQQPTRNLVSIPKYSIYHFFQKKDTYKDPKGQQIRIFKMPKFLIPTLILLSSAFIYHQAFSKKETIIKINEDQ
ncbi:unnamed protein product (macronuclear) [Paramecium tetraurelia]|uniref:Uncharacterized protein n=1 Tax=Paramecium tetraurelia TaxID=5888 RepID=A0C3M3_PARTE|nr:uncharacterized protein GSPATT00034869001 [Paramecium tetraurelia]CAK65390.1 unnamed protein product [Paramecium tetraurelia]|eukprot:XP_001432787.1 hypothetical protein (macronuclear) [Paramecium tetraurelia strain d4-2]